MKTLVIQLLLLLSNEELIDRHIIRRDNSGNKAVAAAAWVMAVFKNIDQSISYRLV